MRSNAEYPDYPYARFDVSLDKLTIGDDDWALLSEGWGEINKDAKSGSASTASTAGGSGSVKANKSMAEKLILKTESKIPLWTREETETLSHSSL